MDYPHSEPLHSDISRDKVTHRDSSAGKAEDCKDNTSADILSFLVRIRDIAQGNMVVLRDDDIDEAGKHLCSSGADLESRSTPGDRSLINLPNVPVDRQYYHQLSINWHFWAVDIRSKGACR